MVASTFFPWQPGQAEIARHLRADDRQRLSERQHVLVLVLVAHRPPAGVVAILFPAARVAAGGLDVAVRIGADPDILVGRRDRQLADARDRGGIADRAAACIDEAEPGARPASRDPGRRVGGVEQLCRARDRDRIPNIRRHVPRGRVCGRVCGRV